jgi:hypothetical protein
VAEALRGSLRLAAPTTLHTSPDADRLYVRFPTWFWIDASPGITAPQTAVLGPDSVEASPEFQWNTGDGNTITCAGVGTPYDASLYDAAASSPDCGYTYLKPGHYTLTLTVRWTVRWYRNGEFVEQLQGETLAVHSAVTVNEIQAIIIDVE